MGAQAWVQSGRPQPWQNARRHVQVMASQKTQERIWYLQCKKICFLCHQSLPFCAVHPHCPGGAYKLVFAGGLSHRADKRWSALHFLSSVMNSPVSQNRRVCSPQVNWKQMYMCGLVSRYSVTGAWGQTRHHGQINEFTVHTRTAPPQACVQAENPSKGPNS